MRLKRTIAAAFAVLLFGVAFAAGPACATGAACAEGASAPLEREAMLSVVKGLFAACAGTTVDAEVAFRKTADADEVAAHLDALADYRARTLPWLISALTPLDTTGLEVAPRVEDARLTEGLSLADGGPYTLAYAENDSYAAFFSSDTGAAYLDVLAQLGAEDQAACLALTQQAAAQWLAEIDHAKLSEINGDYVCWLYGPDTQIDYPVVQHAGNDYYLNHLFNHEQNAAGTLFIDYRNLPDFGDPNTLLYGHHMRNGSMFKSIEAYTDRGTFEARPYLLLYTPDALYLIEIFSGYTTDSSDPCYDIAISSDEDKLAFIERALRMSDFDAHLSPALEDRFVTLSTCAYRFENARYVGIGRLRRLYAILPVPPVEIAADSVQ